MMENHVEKPDYGNLTEEGFLKLQKQHGKLSLITVGDSDEEKIYFWFKKPDIKTLSAAARFQESDPVQSAHVFFKNCLVHGDVALADDPDIFWSVAPLLQNLLQRRVAVIKNY